MRRSGKTTRTVDKAIQVLFEQGAVIIPSYQEERKTDFFNRHEIVRDPDVININGQTDVIKKILRRLELEHRGLKFEFNKKDRIKLL